MEKQAKTTKQDTKKAPSTKPGRVVFASLRFLRMSPRKVRVVTNAIKNMPVVKAGHYLQLLNKAASRPVVKLLNSAVANGENNFQMDKDNLFIKKIVVNQGPTLKRYQPRAHGRATMIRKKSSHIELVLGEIKPTAKKAAEPKEQKKDDKKKDIKTVSLDEVKKTPSVELDEKTSEKGSSEKSKKSGVKKRFFSRKTG